MSTNVTLSIIAKSRALLALAAFIFVHHSTGVWSAESLRLGFSGATATQLAGSIAVEQKLFELYGVNVEFIQSAGSTMIRALDARSLDVAIVGGGQALSAFLKGVDVRIIGGLRCWRSRRRRWNDFSKGFCMGSNLPRAIQIWQRRPSVET